MPAILTLTTDFGLSDPYAAAMKGVILGIVPSARIIDVTHQIRPYQIREAASVIGQTYRWYPKKTVHVVVVDPGVGSERRPVLVEAAGQYFVGPDNGVFSAVYEAGPHAVRHITAKKRMLARVSQTFHGRDVFAPAAAHLLRGALPASFGPKITDYARLAADKPVRTAKHVWVGAVQNVDLFGNLITNFSSEEFPELKTRPFVMLVGIQTVERMIRYYAEAGSGEAGLIEGSSGFYEVAANQASAAKLLGCGAGTPVELTIY